MTKPKYYYHTTCNVCGGKQKRVLFAVGSQHLVRCERCGLRFLDKQRCDLVNLYDEQYYFDKGSTKANYENYEQMECKTIVRHNFQFAYHFIENQSGKKKLLDIGAGFGAFIRNLPKTITAEAVDVSPFACQKMRASGLHVLQGDILKVKIGKTYDYITSFDVIEHKIHLKDFLHKIHTHLTDNGYFLFTTPDYGSIWNKILGKRAPTVQPLYHNYYFDKTWIAQNFPLFGFKIVSMHTTYCDRMPLGQALLLASFIFPAIRKIPLYRLFMQSQLSRRVIPSFRLGGIQVIAQKITQ